MGQTASITILIVLGLGVAGLAVFGFLLLQQQGRLLLRLDQVERRLGLDPEEGIERETVALQARGPAGLPTGTLSPTFISPISTPAPSRSRISAANGSSWSTGARNAASATSSPQTSPSSRTTSNGLESGSF